MKSLIILTILLIPTLCLAGPVIVTYNADDSVSVTKMAPGHDINDELARFKDRGVDCEIIDDSLLVVASHLKVVDGEIVEDTEKTNKLKNEALIAYEMLTLKKQNAIESLKLKGELPQNYKGV